MTHHRFFSWLYDQKELGLVDTLGLCTLGAILALIMMMMIQDHKRKDPPVAVFSFPSGILPGELVQFMDRDPSSKLFVRDSHGNEHYIEVVRLGVPVPVLEPVP